MFVVVILEEEKLAHAGRHAVTSWPYMRVTEVRGPFKDQDRANQYIRNHLPPSLAEWAQSWKVDNI